MRLTRAVGIAALLARAAMPSGSYNPEHAEPSRATAEYMRGKKLFAASCTRCHAGAQAIRTPLKSADLTAQLGKCAGAERANLSGGPEPMKSLQAYVVARYRAVGPKGGSR